MSKSLPHPPKIHPTFIPTIMSWARPVALSLPGAKILGPEGEAANCCCFRQKRITLMIPSESDHSHCCWEWLSPLHVLWVGALCSHHFCSHWICCTFLSSSPNSTARENTKCSTTLFFSLSSTSSSAGRGFGVQCYAEGEASWRKETF